MADRMCDTEDSLSCYHLAECSNGRERDYGNKLLPSTAGTSLTAPPSQVGHMPWHKGKRQPNNNEDDDSPGMEVSVRVNWTMSCIKLASVRKNSWVIVIVDTLLEGKRVLNIQNRLLRGVCCFLWDPGLKMQRESSPHWYSTQVIIHY